MNALPFGKSGISEQERFWMKVGVGGADECWPWLAATKGLKKSNKEHGNFRVRRAWEWRWVSAHILAWEYVNGPHPGVCVLHRCDYSLCCNPSHMFLGTIADNNRDMHEKRRHQFGDQHWTRRRLAGVVPS